MTAPARLLSLRVHGFKSFAEKTVVEFGPGISAVVGPNGSGKSNLVDGLRWALGEQGRALRSRKSEDVIFAGSERRSAQGMADVVLTLDNGDRLMPLDFGTLELGRRLFRSGENEYLLNRQRVRLRELVDLLDAAHLADNAFLFIGQGMVDQALALRPEERRPLFEEVAGVRRHERRKARAEQQLAEADLNLARVGDILAELRPQVRRLATQAEQHTSRQAAARSYGEAVIAAAHERWHEAAAQAAMAAERVQHGRAEAARAMRALRDAEEGAAAVSSALATRSRDAAERRAEHDAARTRLTELQLRDARLGGELASVERDRRRIDGERSTAEAELAGQRRVLSVPLPARDERLGQELVTAERALGDALQELSGLRAAQRARGEELAAIQRAEAARQAEREAARRSLAEAGRRADEELAAERSAAGRLEVAERELDAARRAHEAASVTAQGATQAREAARLDVERKDGERRVAADRAAAESGRLAAAEARLEALARQLEDESAAGIAAAARRVGGRSIEAGLQVEPRLRAAVDAALGDAVRAYVVDATSAERLAGERGVLVVEPGRGGGRAGSAPSAAGVADGNESDDGRRASSDGLDGRWAAAVERAAEAGGGRLADAITRDPTGAARRLLRRALWLPSLRDALDLRAMLEPGWVAVTQDGAVLGADGLLALGRSHARLELRAELDRLTDAVAEHRLATERVRAASAAADEAAAGARERHEEARRADEAASVERRRREDDERRAARAVEGLAREAGWHAAQAARLGAERDRATAALTSIDAEVDGRVDVTPLRHGREHEPASSTSAGDGAAVTGPDASALEHWERRVAELRSRRDRLAAEDVEQERRRRDAEARAAQAAAAIALGEQRIARADVEARDLDDREEQLRAEIARLTEERAAAASLEAAARAALEVLRTADDDDRVRLAAAESAAAASRERLRLAEERIRSAEVADLEARLGLDAVREQALVELASLGDLGPALLREASGPAASAEPSGERAAAGVARPPSVALPGSGWPRHRPNDGPGGESEDASDEDEADAGADLEAALADAAPYWAATPPTGEAPAPARLATLRRRFHDVGAVNPFAVEEHAAARARLDHLDSQRQDLETAIARTRTLIADLNALIADQFRTTFRALETAFDRRFRTLFGGGFARLSLTEPDDLAATGVEIVARPPGKKAQNLAMLSGGERALTAVALLFAMLEVRPVPFCVLDEVDAALDEANVGRFADSLRELAGETQFIVITHNRGTIETADALYGVTIGDDAVSRVVSLRLEEARELAERSSTSDALSPATAS